MDYFVDADFIYLSLSLGWGIDAFWIDEGELTAEGLAPFKAVIITEPHLPAAAQAALLKWVHVGGGSIITTMGAASFDEYNTPSSVLIDGLGIRRPAGLAAQPTTLRDGQRSWANISGTAVLPNGLNLTAWGPLEATTTGPSSTVLAKFDHGKPALITAKAGAGQAFHFPWHPGLSVARAENLAFDLHTYGQANRLSPGIGWLLRNASLAAVGTSESRRWPAVDVSTALSQSEYQNGTYVETPVLDSARGTLVTVLVSARMVPSIACLLLLALYVWRHARCGDANDRRAELAQHNGHGVSLRCGGRLPGGDGRERTDRQAAFHAGFWQWTGAHHVAFTAGHVGFHLDHQAVMSDAALRWLRWLGELRCGRQRCGCNACQELVRSVAMTCACGGR